MSDIHLARSLRDIDQLQDEVLAELDDLNRRIEHAISRFSTPSASGGSCPTSPPTIEMPRLADGSQHAKRQIEGRGVAQHAGDRDIANGPHVQADQDR